jgi:hypothetical protein
MSPGCRPPSAPAVAIPVFLERAIRFTQVTPKRCTLGRQHFLDDDDMFPTVAKVVGIHGLCANANKAKLRATWRYLGEGDRRKLSKLLMVYLEKRYLERDSDREAFRNPEPNYPN